MEKVMTHIDKFDIKSGDMGEAVTRLRLWRFSLYSWHKLHFSKKQTLQNVFLISITSTKVIREKSRGGRFLWNKN